MILVVGATGFIGRRLTLALRATGHEVREAARVDADFTRDLSVEDWLPRLAGVDVVVNAVGILRERGAQTFERIHDRGPRTLFDACVRAGVRRVVQISALGAEHGGTGYFASKRSADLALASLPIEWVIVRPSVVYGAGGASARLFTMLARLPVIPLPGRGEQQLQPIHVEDLVAVIVRLIEAPAPLRQHITVVGPEAMSLRELLQRLRTAMGLRRAPVLRIPGALMSAAAMLGQSCPRSLLDRDTLAMLNADNVGSPALTERWLGHPPRSVDRFISGEERDGHRWNT